MYQIFENFITEDEADKLKEFVSDNKNSLRNIFNLYKNQVTLEFDYNNNYTHCISLSKVDNWPETLSNVINRMQEKAGVSKENPNTPFGWVISYATKEQTMPPHFDLKPINKPDAIVTRMNVIIQNSEEGGNFNFFINDKWEKVNVPERALIVFLASEVKHWVDETKGLKPRINLSIDSIN